MQKQEASRKARKDRKENGRKDDVGETLPLHNAELPFWNLFASFASFA